LVWSQSSLADEVELNPLIKEGLAGEVLQSDLMVPSQSMMVGGPTGSGSILSGIQDQLPVSISQYGRPGNLSQVRGYGISAEDVDSQSFGISLNPPQGGGFDLSAFPFYLWSGASFQSGPSLNGLNPSARSGTLTLTPWTVDALSKDGRSGRAGSFYSSTGVEQIFAAGKSKEWLAWVFGYSFMKAQGPSAGLSARWKGASDFRYSGGLHLLATDLDAEAQGPVFGLSPLARMRTTRMIPVLENSYSWNDSRSFRSSLFFDFSLLRYQDPGSGFESRDQVQQWGMENALEWGVWRMGASFRQANYFGLGFQAPLQTIGNFQFSRTFGSGAWMVEPLFQAVWVNGFGILPQGSLGFRNDWGKNQPSFFLRLGFSQKVPSLLDRYFVYGQFVGNPDLKTEETWSTTTGVEWSRGGVNALIQLYGQYRSHVRVLLSRGVGSSMDTVSNLGGAGVLAVQNTLRYQLDSSWGLYHSFSWSPSLVYATGRSFPYLPSWTEILGVNLKWGLAGMKSEWSGVFRASSRAGVRVNTEQELPGQAVLDTALDLPISGSLRLAMRVENLLNQEIQWNLGYPMGRIFSVLLSGQI
jgi:hypothetical protein